MNGMNGMNDGPWLPNKIFLAAGAGAPLKFSGKCEEGGLSFCQWDFLEKGVKGTYKTKANLYYRCDSFQRAIITIPIDENAGAPWKKRLDAGAANHFSVAQVWWPDFSHLTKYTNSPGAPIHAILAEQFGLPFIAGYVMAYMLVTMGC